MTRPPYCCGKCPELARGGYDCTCKGNPRCPKATRLDVAWARFVDRLLEPYYDITDRIIVWAWKRQRRKYMRKSYPWKGQND